MDQIIYTETFNLIRYGDIFTHSTYAFETSQNIFATKIIKFLKIPGRKEFITTDTGQLMSVWSVDHPNANRFDPPTLINRIYLRPPDLSFFAWYMEHHKDLTKTLVFATGKNSKYLMQYNWDTKDLDFFELPNPMFDFALNKYEGVFTQTGSFSLIKCDLTTKVVLNIYS